MAKFTERIKARMLRSGGISIITIARKLNVSKSSVSEWCRNIVLTKKQLDKLKGNKGVSLTTGQRMGTEANKKIRLNAISKAEEYGRNFIKRVSNRELILIATALYWSEGAKDNGTSTFVFCNSDPDMILVIKKFLISAMKVNKKDIICRIQINRIHERRIGYVLKFWKKLLKLNGDQIKKPYFIDTKVQKIYENYSRYFGVCRLSVRKGKYMKYRIIGLIKALKEEILPA